MSEKRDGETMEQFVIRQIREDERAKILRLIDRETYNPCAVTSPEIEGYNKALKEITAQITALGL
jgi:hypothetical protein